MKTNRYLSFCMVVLTAALLAGMVSCKKEKGPSELRAVMNDFATSGQKAYIDPEQYSCFVVREKVRVNNSTGTITALERNDRQCVISGVAGLPEVTSFRAFYPAELLADSNVDLSSGLNNVAVTLPQEQEYKTDANGNQIIKNPMMAELTGATENNSTLHFRNLCALLKITVRTNKAFDKISVTMPGANLCGTGTISNDIITVTSNVGSTVTLALDSGHHGSPAGEAFYIMVPEVTVSACTVQILNGNTPVETFTRTGSATFAANKIHTLGNFTFDAPVFSIASNKQVVFAPGNLQWSANAGGTSHSTATTGYNGGTWRFAEHQYDFIGESSSDWIDLFGWGTSGYNHNDINTAANPSYNGFSNNASPAANQNYDWGVFNTIYNTKTKTLDPFKTWRTLTHNDWNYLLFARAGSNSWHYNMAKIKEKDVIGLLVYPDGWERDYVGAGFTKNSNAVKEITLAQYEEYENKGCAFLPCAGRKVGNNFSNVGTEGFYWPSDGAGNNKLYFIYFKDGSNPSYTENYNINSGGKRSYSVRLARNVKE